MELFKSSKPSWIIYVVCMISFLYLSCVKDWREDLYDPNLACSYLYVTVLGGLSVVTRCNTYVLLCVFCEAWSTVKKSGWLRCVAFVVCVCILSCFLLVGIVYGLLLAWTFSKDAVVNTMEKNIVKIDDNKIHHLPWISSISKRRQGEDSEVMQCSFDFPWPGDRRPSDDVLSNWTWSLNNTPISWTSRHAIKVTWAELSESDTQQRMTSHGYWGTAGKATLKTRKNLFGISVYKANMQLQIRHLKASDFGSYECYSSNAAALSRKAVEGRVSQVLSKLCYQHLLRIHWPKQKRSIESFNRRLTILWRKSEKLLFKARRLFWPLHVSQVEARKGSFHVIEAFVKTIRLILPPGAFVSINTHYKSFGYHDNEIGVDYLVNSRSLQNLPRHSRCSWSLLLYLWLTGGLQDSFLFDTTWGIKITNKYKSQMGLYLFCLGPETYGQWELEVSGDSTFRPAVRTDDLTANDKKKEVSGQVYDSHNKRIKMFITILPFTVIIVPCRQTLYFDLFSRNSLNWTEPESVELNRSLTDEELKIYSELAQAESRSFKYEEYFFFGTALLIVYYLVRFFLRCVSKIGAFLKKNVLEGPRPKQNFEPNNFANPNRQTQDQHYHVFLSHSEIEVPRMEEVVGQMKVERQRVFFPFHDIPPNRPILPTTDAAIEKSGRFVIFFSEDYVEENMFEAERIVHHVRDSGQDLRGAILVVKLDFSGLPVWLQQCTVHDWTVFGSNIDSHLEKLNSWLGSCTPLEDRLGKIKIAKLFSIINIVCCIFSFLITVYIGAGRLLIALYLCLCVISGLLAICSIKLETWAKKQISQS